MENEATQVGASIHEKIMAKLEPQPSESEEVIQEEQSAEAEVQAETEEVEIQEESNESQDIEVEAEEEVAEDATQDDGIPLSDIAAALGLDEDKLDIDEDGQVVLKTKIDGEEGKVKPSDWLKSYQLEGHLNKQNMEVVEQKKMLEQKQSELESQVQTKFQEAESVVEIAWNELNREYQSIDWNELRQDDPAEYAARQQDFKQRQESIQGAYQKVQQEKQEQAYQQQLKLHEHLQAEDQKLYSAIDGWDNPDKAQKEYSDVMSYLKNDYSFSNENLYGVRDQAGNLIQPGISDHRIVVLARKAMLYDQLQTSKPTITKKVRKAPKIAKPGAIKPVDLDAKKKEELKKQVIKSDGKQGSVAAYLLGTGKV